MGNIALRVAWTLVRIVWVAAMIAAPLAGFWLASSLAAYDNASQWLALAGGLALFPALPVAWEALAAWRRRRRGGKPPTLTLLDRLVLRTLVTSGLFLGATVYFARGTALRALSVRGDWMLDGYEGAFVDDARAVLLGLADGLQRHTHDSRFGTSDRAPEPSAAHPTPKPAPTPAPAPDRTSPPPAPSGWPLPDAPDPIVQAMPDLPKIDAVGAYLRAHFTDRRQLVKAIHDTVVLRLSYDTATLQHLMADPSWTGEPSQQAEAVFARRTAVCEGYARLMVALGKAAGVDIAYVTGHIRDAERRTPDGDDATIRAALEGQGHAWNAVEIDGQWQLVDATWDDPVGAPDGHVSSTYLFTPPAVFGWNHLPDDPNWQLVASPLSLGDFAREPLLSPEIARLGVTLVAPTRSQVTVDGAVTIVLANPYHADLEAVVRPDDGSGAPGSPCQAGPARPRQTFTCHLAPGAYEVRLFGAPASAVHAGTVELTYLGSVLANSR